MKRSFLISEESELDAVLDQFILDFPTPVTVRMDAEMGAGKTTFINCFCRKKGVEESSSPTFSIVNEYRGSDGNTIYHFDLYRLKNPEEALDFGFEEYLDSGAYVFIEWPEKAEAFILPPYVQLTIEFEGKQRRIEYDFGFRIPDF
jgi:tRNA threonylcarbamoyladenosine biosynthesis protein TsaE